MSEYKDHTNLDAGTTLEQQEHPRQPITTVSADGSFESMPFFLISHSTSGRANELSFSRSSSYTSNGKIRKFNQGWTVRAAGNLGLPKRFDQDVYMAVHEILRERGGIPRDGVLKFSMYELGQWLRDGQGGQKYRDMRESLNRIALTTIESTNAFWSARSRKYVSDSFSLWTFHFSDYSNSAKGIGADRQMLRFHPLFIENYEENYLNDLDSEFYWSLTDHGSKRLYRLLESYAQQGSAGKRMWECDLFELRDLIPLGIYSYPSKIKQVLARPHDELLHNGFLSDVSIEKVAKGDYSVRYELSDEFSQRRQKEALETNPEYFPALDAMRRAGIKRAVRLDVVQRYDLDLCLELASLLPYKSGLKSPDAALRWSLNNPEKGREWLQADRDWERPADTPRINASSTNPKKPDGGDSSGCFLSRPGQIGDFQGSAGRGEEIPSKDRSVDKGVIQQSPGPISASNAGEGEQATTENKQQADEIYQQIVRELSDNGSIVSVGVWFDGICARSLSDGVLTLVVPNEQARDYIGGRFTGDIQRCLSGVLRSRDLPGEARLELVVAAGV